MKRNILIILPTIVLLCITSFAQGKHGQGHRRDSGPVFSDRDRDVIRGCLSDPGQGLPPGLAKKDRLPPGLEKQLRKNGTLPPGLQKRAQRLPISCERQLPALPAAIERVILNRRVLIIDAHRRILDLFNLDQ